MPLFVQLHTEQWEVYFAHAEQNTVLQTVSQNRLLWMAGVHGKTDVASGLMDPTGMKSCEQNISTN